MLWWILGGMVLLLLVGYALYRAGNPSFWRTASRHPDEAYDWFMKERCWLVVHPDDPASNGPEPMSDCLGPFTLWVPKLGWKRVTIYRKQDKIEDSERRFLEHLRRGYTTGQVSNEELVFSGNWRLQPPCSPERQRR